MLGGAVEPELLVPDALRYVDCHRLEGDSIIWQPWSEKYRSQWFVRYKWATSYERTLKFWGLVWLVNESNRRADSRLTIIPEKFRDIDSFIRSEVIQIANGNLTRRNEASHGILWIFSGWRQGRQGLSTDLALVKWKMVCLCLTRAYFGPESFKIFNIHIDPVMVFTLLCLICKCWFRSGFPTMTAMLPPFFHSNQWFLNTQPKI